MISFKKLYCGIGKSEIKQHEICITDYPFKPSIAFPNKNIKASEIDAISIDFGTCKILTQNDIVFVSAENKKRLKKFSLENNIKLIPHSWNWDWLLEPYLDTEFTTIDTQKTTQKLLANGISETEIQEIRTEIASQMYKYNSLLWEWCSLGLADVLSAMRAKYNDKKFTAFYKKAIEIEKQGTSH